MRNKALGAKLVQKLYKNSNSLWASILKVKYLDFEESDRIFTTLDLPKGSQMWNFMLTCRQLFLPNLARLVHDGNKACF